MRSTDTITNAGTYLIWLAARHGVDLPSDVQCDDAGLYVIRGGGSDRDRVEVLRMPGYGAATAVDVQFLDDTGEVVRSSRIGTKPNGSLAQTVAQVRDMTGKAAKAAPLALRPVWRGEVLPEGVTLSAPKLAAAAALRMTSAEMAAYALASRPRNADGSPYGVETPAVEVLDWLEVVDAPAPIAPPLVAAVEEIASTAAVSPDDTAAPIAAAAAWAESEMAVGADHDATYRAFVGLCVGLPLASAADGWARTQGKQRDRKARNRGKVVVGTHALDRIRAAFETIYRVCTPIAAAPVDPAPATPIDPAPPAPVEPATPVPAVIEPATPVPAAGDALAGILADMAALQARVAALQAVPAADARRATRLRTVRAYLQVRHERALLRSALAAVGEMNAALTARVEAAEAGEAAALQRVTSLADRVAGERVLVRTLRDKRGATARRLAYTRAALTKSGRAADAASADALVMSQLLRQAQSDLAKFQPLATALTALMPAPVLPPVPVLVASNGRDLRAAA